MPPHWLALVAHCASVVEAFWRPLSLAGSAAPAETPLVFETDAANWSAATRAAPKAPIFGAAVQAAMHAAYAAATPIEHSGSSTTPATHATCATASAAEHPSWHELPSGAFWRFAHVIFCCTIADIADEQVSVKNMIVS